MRQESSRLITEIVDDQRQAIRQTVETGLADGRNPRNVALDLVGRLNRQTGRREGGIVGLTTQQAGYVTNARRQLEELDSTYFQRTLRDKRHDRTVAKAIREGKQLSRADIDRITGRYADRLLAHRGEVMARTESIASLHAGQYEAAQQLVETGKVRADQITKVWDSSGDLRTRPTHAAMDGQAVGLNQPFVSPSGARLMHPHDVSLGAPADEIINCRCFMAIRVRYL